MTRLAIAILGALVLAACGGVPSPTPRPIAPTLTPQPSPTAAPSPQLVPTRAPIAQYPLPSATATAPTSSPKRVLFINGDFVPESGYPHSRVRDDGTKPESFSKLRAEVLEGELELGVDELILDANTTFDAERLKAYAVVVLGSNGRVLTGAEADALVSYLSGGGGVLVYADFQFGPTNWASDNAFLSRVGIEVFPDNFQPRTQIADLVASHPLVQGVKAIEVEGISQFLVPKDALGRFEIVAKCSPLERSGCALQAAEQAKVKPGDAVACVLAREHGNGRLAGVCDRNPFHNGPQKDGTDLGQADNRALARNLFRWLARL